MPQTLDQVALLLTYVIPGFVFLWVAALFFAPRESQPAQLVLPSIVFSIPLTIVAKALLSRFAQQPADTIDPLVLPSVSTGIAILAALALSAARRIRKVRVLLTRLTLVSEPRVWRPVLADHDYYVQLLTDEGQILFGWIGHVTNDPSLDAPDVLLRDVATVDAAGNREPLEYTSGVLIPGHRIRWIQLLRPEK